MLRYELHNLIILSPYISYCISFIQISVVSHSLFCPHSFQPLDNSLVESSDENMDKLIILNEELLQ